MSDKRDAPHLEMNQIFWQYVVLYFTGFYRKGRVDFEHANYILPFQFSVQFKYFRVA